MRLPAPSIPVAAMRRMSGTEWLMLLALSLLWGGSFFFIGVAVKSIPILSLVAARCLIGALVLHLVLRLNGIAFPTRPEILVAFAGMGILNNVVPFSLLTFGQSLVPSGLASILNATTPIFTILFAHFFTRDEAINPGKLIGVLLGFFGVASLFEFHGIGGQDPWQLIGQAACLAAAISYGLAGIFGRRFARLGVAPMTIAAGQLSVSALVMLPIALLAETPWTLAPPPLPAILAVLALGIVSTAGAYILFFRILTQAGATNVSLVTLLVPCSAILLGAMFLGESLRPSAFLGFALIGAGILAIDGRLAAFLRPPHSE